MKPTCAPGCTCDCCTGVSVRTPRSVANRQQKSALRYRVGTWGDFYATMVARLATVKVPELGELTGTAGLAGSLIRGLTTPGVKPSTTPLAALTARTTDDPALVLIDAWSVVLDVLSFYQERIANEGYLRTAT